MGKTDEFDFKADPLDLFLKEFQAAQAAGLHEPHAMSLATVTSTGQPRVRTVLFKGFSEGGFRFFTNYESDKGKELSVGRAALLFHWNTLERQVRIEGRVEKTSRQESEEYFNSRPRASQLGAWSSEQSREIESFDWLEKRFLNFEAQFAGKDIPCPPHWGGFRVIPFEIEFWFGRPGRMHERYVFSRLNENDPWRRSMRSP